MVLSSTEVPEHLFHEVANLFPPMSEEEFHQLLADIQHRGLIEPIWTYHDQIIDGRHRYRACRVLGIEPSSQEWDGAGSLVGFVVSKNLHRRHLSSTQKAILALEIERQLGQEAKHNQSLGGGDHKSGFQKVGNPIIPIDAARQAARAIGTNHHYVSDAKRIVAKAPELREKMKCGELTLPEAKVLAGCSEAQRTLALRMKAGGEVRTVKAAILQMKQADLDAQARAAAPKPCITLASWEQWLPEQARCDVLLTDPPYSTEVEDIEGFALRWLPVALSKVKASGRAYVCIGGYPRELLAYLSVPVPEHLSLDQLLIWTYKNTLGPSPVQRYKHNWQAILLYTGREAPSLDCPLLTEQFAVQDINAPDGRLGNRYHRWQKPDELAERLIRHSTRPGDTVLDCFAGTGTFLLAAHRLGRDAVGCECSEEMLKLAEKRGCARAK